MKTLPLLTLLLFPLLAPAQSFSGGWRGTLASTQNQAIAMPATMTVRITDSQLTGILMLQNNGASEKYTLAGTVQDRQAAGTVTYSADGSVFQFEGLLQDGQFVLAVGLLGIPALAGTFTRTGGSPGGVTTPNQTAITPRPNANLAPVAADGLLRNQKLVGRWAYTRRYSSGEFYGSTRSLLIFFPDGRLGSGASSGNASLGNSSVSSSADGIDVTQGVRWYTRGEQIWLRYAGKGSAADQLFSEFGMAMDGQKMLLYRNGGKQLYERIN